MIHTDENLAASKHTVRNDDIPCHPWGKPARPRVEWVDYAKAICILCVVYGHAIGGLMAAGLMPATGVHALATNVMYTFRMPTLFFLSGLFLARAVRKNPRVFFLDRAAVLIYPALLWTIIQAGTRSIASQSADALPKLRDVMFDLPFYPFGELWFLYVLFLICAVFYVLHSLRFGPWAMLGSIIVLYFVPIVLSSVDLSRHMHALAPIAPRLTILRLACRHSLFAGAGYILSTQASPNLMKLPRHLWLLISGASLTIVVLLTQFLLHEQVDAMPAHPDWCQTTFADPLLALFGGGAVIGMSKWLAAAKSLTILKYMGRKSMQIYLAHPLVTGGLRVILGRLGYIHHPLLLVIVLWSGGLSFPLALDWIVRKTRAFWIFSLRPDRVVDLTRASTRESLFAPPGLPTPAVESVLSQTA